MNDGGLSFDFSEDQRLFRSTLREFVDARLPKSYGREVEQRTEFPEDLWQTLGAQGLHGVGIPEEYDGQGGGLFEQLIVAEELSRTLAGLAWVWALTAFAGTKAVGLFGTPEQKAEILPRVARGDQRFAIALTEPDGGTDIFRAMRTRATRVDGGWLVNGSKTWSTLAHAADTLLLIARTSTNPDRVSDGLTVFLCDAKAEGVTTTKIPKLGMRSIASCEVSLQEVFVPDSMVLGEPDHGWRTLSATLNNERIIVAANCCGALEGVLEDMISYASERVAFGKPIGQFQAIQHMIADTQIALETARLHTYRAAWLQANDRPCGTESTMAKIVASEAVVAAADRGIQILGGYGYSLEYDMQRYWRDMRLFRLAPISNEMGRNFLGERLGLPRSF